jgi:hypothetical protein
MPGSRREARLRARENSRKAKWSKVRFRDNRTVTAKDSADKLSNECWCGEPMNHRWPGWDEGVPHPNPREVADLPPKVQAREAQLLLQESGVCPICRGYPEHLDKGCATCLHTGLFPPPSYEEARKILKERENDGPT